jgi:hypothetical protein
MLKHQLETYKWFPFVAWTICIVFALFVYQLTLNLKQAQNELAAAQENLEQNTKIDPQLIPTESLQPKLKTK